MIADPDNCHLFYKCDVHPVALSCGDMMFNTVKQVSIIIIIITIIMIMFRCVTGLT